MFRPTFSCAVLTYALVKAIQASNPLPQLSLYVTKEVVITFYPMIRMSWSHSAYHGHLMSLKQLSTHKMAQTGLQKKPPPNVCIVSGDLLADDSVL